MFAMSEKGPWLKMSNVVRVDSVDGSVQSSKLQTTWARLANSRLGIGTWPGTTNSRAGKA